VALQSLLPTRLETFESPRRPRAPQRNLKGPLEFQVTPRNSKEHPRNSKELQGTPRNSKELQGPHLNVLKAN